MRTRTTLLLVAVVFLSTALYVSWSQHHIDAAGGSYAQSPDGKWFAEIHDGYSDTHQRHYAIIQLWDLTKYPRLENGRNNHLGKTPTVRLEFPQIFNARDHECDVTWASDSSSFTIPIKALSGTSSDDNPTQRRFRYDLSTDTFSLESAAH